MSDSPTGSPSAARIPVPIRLADAPSAQGMVVPFVTLTHRDRSRPVWGKLDPVRRAKVLRERRCQVCGDPLTDPVLLYLRPADYHRGIAVEPALHPECGLYSRRACPMLAGAMDRYNPHPRMYRCTDPACDCPRWAVPEPGPGQPIREGQPADAWYEAWVALDDYILVPDPLEPTTGLGISLRAPVRIRRTRRLRDAGPATGDQLQDLLAVLTHIHRLLGPDVHR